ncbi:hypothetical protein ACFX13_045299 [Malus domestica]
MVKSQKNVSYVLIYCKDAWAVVKEECEETLEKIKEGELIMVLMNSHLELVTTNQLTINFRSRLNYALNV